ASAAALAAAPAAAGANATAAASISAPPAAGSHPTQALPPLPGNPTAAFTALAALPPLRAANLRRPRVLDLRRPSNREAYLGQCVGVASAAPCSHCARGYGPWDTCIVVTGQLLGSCANCHYGNEGKRCSLRRSKLLFMLHVYGC